VKAPAPHDSGTGTQLLLVVVLVSEFVLRVFDHPDQVVGGRDPLIEVARIGVESVSDVLERIAQLYFIRLFGNIHADFPFL
jgi:hypothetical protein